MSERGQASVELVGMLPLVAAIALVVVHVLAAGAASEAAGAAAEAGAIALLQQRDPHEAVRRTLGGDAARSAVTVRGGRVRVILRPRAAVPALGQLLEVRATADAGRR